MSEYISTGDVLGCSEFRASEYTRDSPYVAGDLATHGRALTHATVSVAFVHTINGEYISVAVLKLFNTLQSSQDSTEHRKSKKGSTDRIF